MGRQKKINIEKQMEKDRQKRAKEDINKVYKELKGKTKKEKEAMYDDIYHLYGQTVFNDIASKSYKKKDIKNLLKNGKFEDIYFKYGEKEYNKHLEEMRAKEVAYETGSKKKGVASRIGRSIRNNVVSFVSAIGLGLPFVSIVSSDVTTASEYIQHEEEIQQYIESINDYGESVRKMNLSDIEVLMKVMDDMRSNIKGYGTPKIDLVKFSGLDLATEEGQGVCRNMADDVARKLNAIDKDYNARRITVYFDTSKNGYQIANSPVNVVEDNETVVDGKDEEKEENGNEPNETQPNKDMLKLIGNHAVVLVDINEDNVTLVVDPTNPGIGIYKDGEITMFNTKEFKEEDKIKFDRTYLFDALYNGADNFKIPFELLSTYREPNLSMEELEEKYGVDAQNRALDSAKEKSKTFKDEIKVDMENGDTIYIDFSNEQEIEQVKNDNELEK